MTNLKHTKGPWHVEWELDEDGKKTDCIMVCHTETENDFTAVANLSDYKASPEEARANAYLMAAAPELLSMLQRILDADFGWGGEVSENEVNKLIKKAKEIS